MKDRRLELTVTEEQNVGLLLRRGLNCSAALVRTAKKYPDGILLDGVHATTADSARPARCCPF